MKLYFRNSYGEERLIAEVPDEDAASQEIKRFSDAYNFTSYYTRTWVENKRKYYDIGSWFEFFILDLE